MCNPGDGATIGDKHFQAVGFVRPVMDDEDNVIQFERVVIGCGASLDQTGPATFKLIMQMLGDMCDAHNAIFCGESVAGSKQKRKDKRKENAESNIVREALPENEEPTGMGAIFNELTQQSCGVKISELDFTSPLRIEDLVYGLCGTISGQSTAPFSRQELERHDCSDHHQEGRDLSQRCKHTLTQY